METLLLSKEYPLNILVVDDNPGALIMAREMLYQLGYQPDTAASGKEGLGMIGHKDYDLVLLDLFMKDSGRYGALELLRCRRKAQTLLIGMGMKDDALTGTIQMTCLHAGMDHYISKPMILEELILQLKACCLLTGNRRPAAGRKVA